MAELKAGILPALFPAPGPHLLQLLSTHSVSVGPTQAVGLEQPALTLQSAMTSLELHECCCLPKGSKKLPMPPRQRMPTEQALAAAVHPSLGEDPEATAVREHARVSVALHSRTASLSGRNPR